MQNIFGTGTKPVTGLFYLMTTSTDKKRIMIMIMVVVADSSSGGVNRKVETTSVAFSAEYFTYSHTRRR